MWVFRKIVGNMMRNHEVLSIFFSDKAMLDWWFQRVQLSDDRSRRHLFLGNFWSLISRFWVLVSWNVHWRKPWENSRATAHEFLFQKGPRVSHRPRASRSGSRGRPQRSTTFSCGAAWIRVLPRTCTKCWGWNGTQRPTSCRRWKHGSEQYWKYIGSMWM